ncbi:MAG: DNA methyltransferase [Prevotella sp.]
MATNYYESFIKKLQEIFMMDHAELDFGIYRIMNQKRADINHFLKFELLPQVKTALADAPEDSENEVFSHLVTFFSRYYDNGDFISKRRYKDNTYAIPYNGEEVKLHWANADQYYIKSSEYFRDYSFVLPTSRRKVHFVLKDASTEQNNNKTANNMERRFALYKPETEGEPFYEMNGDELNLFFTYELMPKGTKQNDLMAEAFDCIKEIIPLEFSELLTVKSPTDKNANRTLLEKHLTDYTAKNSFDYFIHKNLGGFLRRELDFYIKNEVMLLDDLDVQHIESQLNIIKAIKLVGEKIIRMLAQLEDFQKKLWLKKKFVVQSDYCITLDRVPRKLYPEILANDRQREEWVRLFAIDEIKGDLTTEAYSVPLTMKFLEQNPFLVLDTAFFSKQFKHKLVASMENVDRDCNGLLIKSDNKHALEILRTKYDKLVSNIYIDPPYNTGSDGFVYKDNYLHSSWLAMIEDRLLSAKSLMKENAPISISINENELFNLKDIMDSMFEKNYYTTLTVKVRHEDRILKGDKDFHEVYENVLFYAKSRKFKPLKRHKDNTSIDEYKYTIETSSYDEVMELDGKNVEVFSPEHYRIKKEKTPSANYLKPISIRGSIREGNSSGRFYVGYLETLSDSYSGYLFKVPNMGDDKYGYRYFWVPSKESGRKNGDYYQGKPINGKDIIDIPYPNYIDFETAFNDATDEGGIAYRNGKKPLQFMNHILKLQKIEDDKEGIILDFFAGSASTGHSVIQYNKNDNGMRKYILIQVNEIFDTITKPRIEKVIYSPDWKDGKPVSRQGISQCFKYMRLEQYEDTLNNLKIKEQQTMAQFDEGSGFKESYMLEYMLDVETRDSLLNLKMFENPFAMTLKTTKDNELVETEVDMVETFNYLIGLNVETEDWYRDENICVVQGHTHRDNLHTLVIWRNCKEIDNEQLNQFFERMDFRTRDSEFDVIYVNGDNLLPNLRRDQDNWKVVLIEEEFTKRMFETE